ncbi:MAG TPA: bifunctional DNA-formamidopyrimidine glycosylase/DNA-(apurinic or apyrimidinic site) lyase [Solirubrobacteraceae bacterium]|nr:bifunctional DNA-formamidopyrimidine glycosylase/DNA-(apurinic or apyrimidinic site) lyase [Solirubrobacteraceae bacterium]
MPELPEVETIRRQLAPHLEGRTLDEVEILDPRWTRPDAPGPVQVQLRGRTVREVGRWGKYLVWRLTGERHLIMHLRMTGALLFDPPVDPPHTRARFTLDGGHRLVYNDPRRFGTGHLVTGALARDAYLSLRLGIEPMTPAFTAEHLRDQARGRTAPIKSFVLDQRRIAGVGNIYADEALFRARIHPLRPAGSLRGTQFEALREAIEHALTAGIDAKGATIDDFRHVDGAQGSFQDLFCVHQREGQPCPACGTAIRKLVVGGRGTYVCERCQPRPRVRSGRAAGRPGTRAASGGKQL